MMQIAPTTYEQKVEMYMRCKKKDLAQMLAMRDVLGERHETPYEAQSNNSADDIEITSLFGTFRMKLTNWFGR